MARNFQGILIAVLIGITIFSVYKFVTSVRDNYDLQYTLDQVKKQVVSLEAEKNNLMLDLERSKEIEKNLTQENVVLKEESAVAQTKISKLEADILDAAKKIEELNSQINVITVENDAVKQQLAQTTKEKEELEFKFTSVSELKTALRQLRRKIRLAREGVNEEIRRVDNIMGNGGYLMRNGKSTYPGQIKIEVQPTSEIK